MPLSSAEWQVTWFSLCVAGLATLANLVPGIALAWLLAKKSWRGKSLVETAVALPLVMPPVATGLILLKLFGRHGLGGWLEQYAGLEIIFTWKAVLLAMSVMAFPLLVRSARVAFEMTNPRLEQVARTLGAGRLRVFFTISLPLAAKGIIAGTVLSFARALGEFGATFLVAGNIPGRTSVLSVAIYNEIQLGRDGHAFQLLGVSVFFAFLFLWLSEGLLRRQRNGL
ncbi:MAG: molybdate ABC transporter permease subunit [Verrucomicrobiales bacterium]|jgi:molybdate transport system permease protein|nr:molybdate ABC transporter permease subunit [Verrucomicrobiales bacterium]